MKKRNLFVILFMFSFLLITFCSILPTKFDILIKNGRIYDGTGNPWYQTDIGIKKGRIAAIGMLSEAKAKITIDATNHAVTPGFIDMHTHAERRITELPAVENYIRQGVTTVVGGNCGGSPYPVGEFLDKVESTGISLNLALLVGHNTIRRKVMGSEDREPTELELEEMKEMVDRAMREGAFGLSTGLKYIPGAYATTEEVVELAKVADSYGGFYASHIRDEGLKLIEAVQEAIEIGRRANIPVQISHHKIVGKTMWGSSERTLQLIDEAASEGLDVTFDQYPYTATSTGLTVLFPAWSMAGGRDSLKKRLENPKLREKIKQEIIFNIQYDRGGGDPASVVVTSFEADSTLAGKNLAEITILRGREPTIANAAETLMELQAEGGGRGIYHCLDESDVVQIMKHPRGMVASDGSTVRFGQWKVHPRNYGTFPRVLGRYVQEKGVLRWKEAVRKMTSLPAQRLRLNDRGLIKEKMWADVVVLNPETVLDNATFLEPHQYPAGIEYVVVNGKLVIEKGEYTGARPGRMLRIAKRP